MKHCEIFYKAVTFVALSYATLVAFAALAEGRRVILPRASAQVSPAPGTPGQQPNTSIVLEDVLDGGESIEESAFYLLLARSRRLAVEPTTIADTSLTDLLENPASYRGKPVRLRLRVWIIRQFYPANKLDWPEAVQELNCKSIGGQPVTVLLTDPQQLHRGNTLEVTGLFYKLHRYRTRATGEDGKPQYALQPLVVARTVTRIKTGRDRHELTLLVSLITIMAVIFIVVRWKVRRADIRMRERRSFKKGTG